ncbi:cytochrome c biogenesis heme-transporting ATPase CcmA [Marinibactrum halimedae]|uniref:Cytochrome c biogenesis ATP-binding export protein CcmA n=1 Tax=Marinibactrum halimedae TaxID=1444977 RepID=A0AA37WQM3_9GAMM|nr:cytochrome c biogenesis heme-transporting ATPase CcmA [Marinibactrum halimedae]MCD9460399.1 cytochrome c biogenesis heme-transporting ATPase CcmA [Marinibactrum halimedae]GLS27472.1 cytochrome c biogenesis ATP-binding export protein CcmA [Marinibactrum halimedae]
MPNSLTLELKDLCCDRDERRLFSHLNAQIESGQVVQVAGPNGSGKTTLLRLLTGISHDYDGDILWQGQSIQRHRALYLSQMLYLGHLPGTKKALTPQENLRWYAGMSTAGKTVTDTTINDTTINSALSKVGLYGFEDVPCYQLSAGQQRRVALARLYLTPAPLWILDEPFTAIDKRGVAELEQAIANHAERGGIVILTTHQDLDTQHFKNIGLRTIDLTDFAGAIEYDE